MELNAFKPKSVKFKISYPTKKGDIGFDLEFRPFTMRDELWIDDEIGTKEEVARIFESLEALTILKMTWHQLDIESKRKIMAIKSVDMNEDGDEVEVSLTGIEKLTELVGGGEDILKILTAFNACKGINQELLVKFAEEELKKKGITSKAKLKELTGLLVLT